MKVSLPRPWRRPFWRTPGEPKYGILHDRRFAVTDSGLFVEPLRIYKLFRRRPSGCESTRIGTPFDLLATEDVLVVARNGRRIDAIRGQLRRVPRNCSPSHPLRGDSSVVLKYCIGGLGHPLLLRDGLARIP